MHANCCRKTKQNWNNHDGYAGEEPSLGASDGANQERTWSLGQNSADDREEQNEDGDELDKLEASDLEISGEADASLIVPAEAIVFNRDGLNVAVVENGVAHIRHVTVVRDLGAAVEVNAGVKDTDQAILNPSVDLTDGQKVRIDNDHPLVVGVGAPGGWP